MRSWWDGTCHCDPVSVRSPNVTEQGQDGPIDTAVYTETRPNWEAVRAYELAGTEARRQMLLRARVAQASVASTTARDVSATAVAAVAAAISLTAWASRSLTAPPAWTFDAIVLLLLGISAFGVWTTFRDQRAAANAGMWVAAYESASGDTPVREARVPTEGEVAEGPAATGHPSEAAQFGGEPRE